MVISFCGSMWLPLCMLGLGALLGLYCIVYRYLYSASHGVSQPEATSVHFSSTKKVRLKARERRWKGSRENKRAKRWREVIPEWRTNRSKRPSVVHGCPNTGHEKIMALGRAERGSRDRGSDVIVGPPLTNRQGCIQKKSAWALDLEFCVKFGRILYMLGFYSSKVLIWKGVESVDPQIRLRQ